MSLYTRLVATEGGASASLLVSTYYMLTAGPQSWPGAWTVWTGLLTAAIIRRGGDVRKIEWHCEPVGEDLETVRVREAVL